MPLSGGGCSWPILVLDISSGNWARLDETIQPSGRQEQNSEISGPLVRIKPKFFKETGIGWVCHGEMGVSLRYLVILELS